jgi:hypothetical protein
VDGLLVEVVADLLEIQVLLVELEVLVVEVLEDHKVAPPPGKMQLPPLAVVVEVVMVLTLEDSVVPVL